jgi:hypothetical protein
VAVKVPTTARGGTDRRKTLDRRDDAGAAPFVPKTTSLKVLDEAAQACRGCDLYRHATQAVIGEGRRSARILLIGEQPGDQEDRQGHPFVGPAGAMLDKALEQAGLTRADVFLTNAVLNELLGPAYRIAEVGVAAVDDQISVGEKLGQFRDRLFRWVAGRDHQPDVAGRFERRNEFGERRDLRHVRIAVVADDLMPRTAEARRHPGAHPAQPDHAYLHRSPHPWPRDYDIPPVERFDVFVIGGGGTGSEVAFSLGRRSDLRIGLAERDKLGGECNHYGCVPTKVMLKSAKVAASARDAERFGVRTGDVSVDFGAVMQRARSIIDGFSGGGATPFEEQGIEVVFDEVRLVGPHRLETAAGEHIEAENIVIATGTEPTAPPIDGLEGAPYWTNKEAIWGATTLPSSLIVLGSGPIGIEFAQVYARFGTLVTLVVIGERLYKEIGRLLWTYTGEIGVDKHTITCIETPLHMRGLDSVKCVSNLLCREKSFVKDGICIFFYD